MSYNDINNASDAYWWVYEHPSMQYCGHASPWIELTPHMVNQEDNKINTDHSLNTKLEWRIECGMYILGDEGGLSPLHDFELDCGGDTADDAVLTLAALVFEKYGDYTD